ncbi:MAG: BatD family protein, partial [Bacteroidales bacterium]|nr:BatD family protein [Bacteroidales bacterium]
MKFKILSILAALIFPFAAVCQDISFAASAPDVVRSGERFALSYTVNANGKNFKAPNMNGFTVLSGPNTSTSTSFQFINGKRSQSVTQTYSFYLVGNQAGEFTIPSATIEVGRDTYQSNTVTIQIVAANAPANGSSSGNSNSGSSSGQTGSSGSSSSDNVFVTTTVNKKNVYVGEQLVLSHRLYTQVELAGFGNVKFPAYTGFWKEDVELGKIDLQQTVYNDQTYYSDEMQRNILFPQRAGEIVIPPSEIEVVTRVRVQQSSGFNDPFFGGMFSSYQNVPVECKTKPITVTVKPLPSENRPGSFSGAVGNFTVSSTIDKTELKANEAITVKYTVKGTGNIKLLDKLNVAFPSDFETYDPKVTQNIQVNTNNVSGTKTFEYVIIPRNAGSFVIKAFDFSYFDPSKKDYVVLHFPEYDIEVEEADASSLGQVVVSGKEDVVSLAEDVKFINDNVPDFSKQASILFASWVFFLHIGLIIIAAIVAIVLILSAKKRNNDIEMLKRKRAESVSMK